MRAGLGVRNNQQREEMLSLLPLNGPHILQMLCCGHMCPSHVTRDILTSQDPRMMICEALSKVIYFNSLENFKDIEPERFSNLSKKRIRRTVHL